MHLFSWLIKKIYRINVKLTEYLALIGGVIILVMMVAITGASLSRYLLGHAVATVTELSVYSLLLITFLGSPLLSRTNGHVSVDLLSTFFKGKGKVFHAIFTNGLSFLVTILLSWYGLKNTISSYASNEIVVDILHTPKYLLYLIITIGFFLMAVSFLSKTLEMIKIPKEKNYK